MHSIQYNTKIAHHCGTYERVKKRRLFGIRAEFVVDKKETQKKNVDASCCNTCCNFFGTQKLNINAQLQTAYLVKHFYLNYKVSAYPHVAQLLPLAPIKIPLLADHVFIGSHKETAAFVQKHTQHHKNYFATAGTTQLLMVCNANDVKLLTITKASKVIKPSEMSALEMFGPNIVTIPGYAEWRRHRILCNPSFSDSHLKYVAEVAVDCAKLLMQRWETKQGHVNPEHDMSDLTMDVIGKVGFGYNLGVLEKRQESIHDSNHKMLFKDALEYIIRTALVMRFLLPDAITFRVPKVKQSLKEVDQYMDEIIASKKKTDKPDLLTSLCTLNESGILEEDTSLEEFKTGTRTKLSFEEIKSDSM